MRRKIYTAVTSFVAVLALVLVEPAAAPASDEGRHHENRQQVSKSMRRCVSRARHRARERRKDGRRAISYVCPMHTDIREKSRGVCPKCLMDLVAESGGLSMGRMGLARKPPRN